MKIGEAFPSNFIKAADLPPDRMVRVQIAKCVSENVAGDNKPPEFKPVLYFHGKNKGMVLNKTNAQIIAGVYGDETDRWFNCEVLLYVAQVLFNKQTVPAIRVKIPSTPAPAQPPIQHAPVRANNHGGELASQITPRIAPAQVPSEAFEGETEAEFNESEIPF